MQSLDLSLSIDVLGMEIRRSNLGGEKWNGIAWKPAWVLLQEIPKEVFEESGTLCGY